MEHQKKIKPGQPAGGLSPKKKAPFFKMSAKNMIHRNNGGHPSDKALVARAKEKLKVLEQMEAMLMARSNRKMRQTSLSRELDRKRIAIADDPKNPNREKMEEANIGKLNRKALKIQVTENAVTFKIGFHVRFEGRSVKQSAQDYQVLTKHFKSGLNLIWNQYMSNMPFTDRNFEVIPSFTHIEPNAARNQNFWLITVRPTDKAPISYNGKPLVGEQPPEGRPTSATNFEKDGGVISVPPSHIRKPGVLGHELLHLFGLVDRYVIWDNRDPKTGEQIEFRLIPTRSTGSRKDPLGSEDGPILREDLNFLFKHLGVYDLENKRDDLEVQKQVGSWSLARVQVEIQRQKDIIRLGYDPNSLIRPRTDFTDKIIESARDL